MGSSLSTASRTAAQQFAKRAPKTNAATSPSPSNPNLSKSDPSITAQVRKQRSNQNTVLYQRPTVDDWAAALKKVSNVITSSTWDEHQTLGRHKSSTDRHPAQRSHATTERLPQQRTKTEAEMHDAEFGGYAPAENPTGRMSQVDVLDLFNLRRQQSKQWDVKALSGKYKVDQGDLADLLRFTRTYAGRVDQDGQIRGYYNPDPKNTIKRFERD
ncbi:unnamed protein product [Agarophyton chilense]